MKKLLALLLTIALLFSFTGCSDLAPLGLDIATDVLMEETDVQTETTVESTSPSSDAAQSQEDIPVDTVPEDGEAVPAIDEDGWYYSAEDVSLYLCTYGKLPENFITKDEARELGWEGGSVEKYAPGYAIGGDKFGNREGLLPKASGRVYYECDIDTDGKNSRGAKRIVFSNDGLIYYTEDHYESFILLYGEE